jgi:hypothetical protein
MNRDVGIIIGAVLGIGIAIFALTFEHTQYERYSVSQKVVNNTEVICEHYTASCDCYGPHLVRDSYPEQHICSGLEHCRPLNRTECRS